MSVSTVTLASFLLARIAEDKAVALAAIQGKWRLWGMQVMADTGGGHDVAKATLVANTASSVPGQRLTWNAQHIAHHDPARVLAECESKLQIVRWCTHHTANPYETGPVLQMLAQPYADRPGYRAEWAAMTNSTSPQETP